MDIEILVVPYDCGHEDARLGRGPDRLLQGGLTELLSRLGHDVTVRRVRVADGFQAEIKTTFALNRALAELVRAGRNGHRFPLVLSGNCFMALGAVTGLDSTNLGIVWFDAHGEFN